MKILRKKEYLTALKIILKYISLDSKNRAKTFKSQLDNKINKLDNFPYKFKQSKLHDNVAVREMVFKGYSILFTLLKKKKIEYLL